jgi:hypothetical protein
MSRSAREVLVSQGWRLDPFHPPGDVWTVRQQVGRLSQVWLSTCAERGMFKVRFYFDSEAERAAAVAELANLLATEAVPGAGEVTISPVKRVEKSDGSTVWATDVLTPHQAILAHRGTEDCEEERDQCEEMCKASLTGRNWSHASAGSKAEICRRRCRPAYLDCSRLREQADAVKFPVTDKAVDWLKRHREEILVGTVIVIAGVAFTVVIVGSAGTALVLVPAVLLVSSEVPSMPYAVEEEP